MQTAFQSCLRLKS